MNVMNMNDDELYNKILKQPIFNEKVSLDDISNSILNLLISCEY